MRVTQAMVTRNSLENLEKLRERVQRRNNEVASGRRLNRPSEDPSGASRTLRLREELARLNQYTRNSGQATTYVNTTADALNSVRNLITSTLVRGGQAITDTLSAKERQSLASDLDEIVKNLESISEITIDGKNIFSGSETATNPLQLNAGTYTYQGDGQPLMVRISDRRSVQINVTASEIFTDPTGDLINSVAGAAEALRNNDTDTARQFLGKIEAAAGVIDVVRTRVLNAVGELERNQTRIDEQFVALTEQVSKVEDADMATSISELLLSETALRASLSAASRAQQLNLFDVIG